jgi:hypothetical protein
METLLSHTPVCKSAKADRTRYTSLVGHIRHDHDEQAEATESADATEAPSEARRLNPKRTIGRPVFHGR